MTQLCPQASKVCCHRCSLSVHTFIAKGAAREKTSLIFFGVFTLSYRFLLHLIRPRVHGRWQCGGGEASAGSAAGDNSEKKSPAGFPESGKVSYDNLPPPLCLTRSMPTPPVMPRNESSQSFVCFFDRQGPEPGCQIQGAQKQRGRASFPR